MSKTIIIFAVVFACFLPPADLAADSTVSSNDLLHAAALAADGVTSSGLIDKASEYDGQSVVYIGEVIGDIMPRGEYTWLNVSDGANAIGIWAKSGDVQDIKIAGKYDAKGDTVRVTGVFHRACAEHGGDFDIHADSVEITERGYHTVHTVEAWKIILAALLFAGAVVCMVFVLRKREKVINKF